ncbi:MAG: crosslink repair DNA glycosylase YcaQ family protein [Pseudomonadota bacterium]
MMSHPALRISNHNARRLFLHAHGMVDVPTGPLNLAGIIDRLGFVQLDTIRVVERAHHHILWSRNQHYRPKMLDKLLAQDRRIFEHFTHDASVIPMTSYPLWRRQFERMEAKIRRSSWYKSMLDDAGCAAILKRIAREGPLSTHAFDTVCKDKTVAWRRPPHKLALDYMWHAGQLATSHRQNFTKFYDLADRVIPKEIRDDKRSDNEQVNWLCQGALDRLSFATCGDIQRFWAATDLAEVKGWAAKNSSNLTEVVVETAGGDWLPMLAPDDIESRIAALPDVSSRLRIVNPFDPTVRDRNRLGRLFGFDFRIEIFVPAAKRRFGYYVFPILEGERFVGRIELRAERCDGSLHVIGFWPEAGIRFGSGRRDRLHAELSRLSRFVGTSKIVWREHLLRQ